MEEKNPMKELLVEKVTLNMGVGQAGEALENAKTLLSRLSGCKAVPTAARSRNPTFKVKKGDLIGAKATIRGGPALEFLKKAFAARGNRISGRSLDPLGNFAFGIPEYIEFPGAKYDPKLGMLGFEVSVTMRRKGGLRVSKRKRAKAKIPRKHLITPQETRDYLSSSFGVTVE